MPKLMHNDAFHLDQNQDHILALLRRESSYITSSLNTAKRLPPPKHIDNRGRVLKWYYEIVAHYEYDREVIPISMDYLDRFLFLHSTEKELSTRTYKIVAMTTLYIAVKLHVGDVSSKNKICLQEYALLGDGETSPADISSMERCILDTLNWKVHPVSPMCFVRYFLKLIEPTETTGDLSGGIISEDEPNKYIVMDICVEALRGIALYFTELAICMPEASAYFHLNRDKHCSMDSHTFAPSTIAYACILLSMEMISYSAIPLNIRESFLRKCNKLHSGKHGLLQPDQKDIKELQNRIQNNFALDKLMNQTAAQGGRDYSCISQSQPIATAINHRLLNSRFLEHISTSCFTNPVKSLSQRDSSHSLMISRKKKPSASINRNVNYSTGSMSSTTKRKSLLCIDRHSSPTSVMEYNAPPSKLSSRKRMRRV